LRKANPCVDFFVSRNLFFSNDIDNELQKADIIFVSVNTPTKITGIGAGRAANVKNCELCARKIAEVSTSSKIVVSTGRRLVSGNTYFFFKTISLWAGHRH